MKELFHFSSVEWDSILPRSDERRLVGSWAPLLSRKLDVIFPECPLIFKRNILHKQNSRKKCGVHLRISAVCKFKGNINR